MLKSNYNPRCQSPLLQSPRKRHSGQLSFSGKTWTTPSLAASDKLPTTSKVYEEPTQDVFSSDSRLNLSLAASLARLRALLFPRVKGRRLFAYFASLVLVVGSLVVYYDAKKLARVHALKCHYIGGSGCSTDPFNHLLYNVSAGHIFYPAHTYYTTPSSPPPPQPHPIHFLIREAEREWDSKVKKQSKTLKEAVLEYKRRYKRSPPRGFGDWFRFAKERKVQMLDEYDQIHERIIPYASMPPEVLRQRTDMMMNDESFWLRANLFTTQVKDHGRTVKVVGPMSNHGGRPGQVLELMKGFARHLPDLDLSMTAHDTPWIIVAGENREKHRVAGEAGKFLTPEELVNFGDDGAYDGWALMCPPESPLRKAEHFDERRERPVPRQTSFIRDHVASMDFCHHPERQAIHGVSAWPGPRPALLFPVFSFTITPFHNDLLLPGLEQWESPVGQDVEWHNKRHDKVVWRGSTTGSDLSQPHMRKYSQRPRLCRLHQQTGLITVPLSPNDKRGAPGPTETYQESAFNLAHEYFDFKFMGHPQQCGNEESCKRIEAEFEWDSHMSAEDQNQYKYVIDVDGNGWSGRFHRLMSSNAMVLKSTVFQEWYSDRIQAWVHYVPIATDYQDLWSVMAFFKGDLDGRGSHDEIAERIAKQGKKWAEEYWRWEDMQAYLFRLLLEYSRVVHFDPANPTAMDFDESSLN